MSWRFVGADLSLNHGAVVVIGETPADEPLSFGCYTTSAGVARRVGGDRLPKFTGDRHTTGVTRLAWVSDWFQRKLHSAGADFLALEDYAVRMENQAHYLGEVGGAARLVAWRFGCRFRLIDPTSVKLFAAHAGDADKQSVREAVSLRWTALFDRFEVGKDTKTAEDLADAYALARIARTEALLRAGKLLLSDLEHDAERRVFIRITKTNPENVLDREWILGPGPGPVSKACFRADRCVLKSLESSGALSDGNKRAIERFADGL